MHGKISQIMGAVVDVEFTDSKLPEIMNALKSSKVSVTLWEKVSKDRTGNEIYEWEAGKRHVM